MEEDRIREIICDTNYLGSHGWTDVGCHHVLVNVRIIFKNWCPPNLAPNHPTSAVCLEAWVTSSLHLQMDGYEMIEGHRPKRNIKSVFKRWSLGEDIKDRYHVKETGQGGQGFCVHVWRSKRVWARTKIDRLFYLDGLGRWDTMKNYDVVRIYGSTKQDCQTLPSRFEYNNGQDRTW